jgi:hypothetical protein
VFLFLAYVFALIFSLGILSATGLVLLHKLFPDGLPPRIAMLADLSLAVVSASAKTLLGPNELLKRIKISFSENPELPPSDDTKLITKK